MSVQGTRQMPIAQALAGGDCLTTAQITLLVGCKRQEVSNTCCKLVSRGWIARRERGCFVITKRGLAALNSGETTTSGPNGPLAQGKPKRRKKLTTRCVIWRSMRILGKFSLAEIETLSGANTSNAQRFVSALKRTGILVPIHRQKGNALTSNGFRRWRLMNDLGPETPIWRPSKKHLFDPNSNKIIEVVL